MKHPPLHEMSIEQLIEYFVVLALEQDKALLYNEIGKFNALFEKIELIEQELKERPGDQRRRLVELFTHENAQVRMKAAEATLAVAPEAARGMLEAIASSRRFPQAGHAGMTINALDRGIFNPT
jgi:hypothetical protein